MMQLLREKTDENNRKDFVMFAPRFKCFEDVEHFLQDDSEAWCLPMVEEYMELIAPETLLEDINIEELNGWIEHELSSVTKGYEGWENDRYRGA
jgi:hypothetical protein